MAKIIGLTLRGVPILIISCNGLDLSFTNFKCMENFNKILLTRQRAVRKNKK